MKGFFASIGRFFKNLFVSQIPKFIERHQDLFLRTVLEVAAGGGKLSGDQKRRLARKWIRAALDDLGEKYKSHWLNLGIELAVAELKAKGKI